jgi:hypothetical protein
MKCLLTTLSMFGLISLWVPSALAAPTLDQSFTATGNEGATSSTANPGFRRAQTFTVGIAGTLISVGVGISDSNNYKIELLSTSGGVPTDTILDTGVFNSYSGGYSFFDTSFAVSVGDVLAIEPICLSGPSCDGPNWEGLGTSNGYDGGTAFFINTKLGDNSFTEEGLDEDFKTFVDVPTSTGVPEPMTWSLLGSGLVGAAAMRRRKKV